MRYLTIKPSCKIALGFITHKHIDLVVYKPPPYELVFMYDKIPGLRPRVYNPLHQS